MKKQEEKTMSNNHKWKKAHKGMTPEQIKVCNCDLCLGTNIAAKRGIKKPEPAPEAV